MKFLAILFFAFCCADIAGGQTILHMDVPGIIGATSCVSDFYSGTNKIQPKAFIYVKNSVYSTLADDLKNNKIFLSEEKRFKKLVSGCLLETDSTLFVIRDTLLGIHLQSTKFKSTNITHCSASDDKVYFVFNHNVIYSYDVKTETGRVIFESKNFAINQVKVDKKRVYFTSSGKNKGLFYIYDGYLNKSANGVIWRKQAYAIYDNGSNYIVGGRGVLYTIQKSNGKARPLQIKSSDTLTMGPIVNIVSFSENTIIASDFEKIYAINIKSREITTLCSNEYVSFLHLTNKNRLLAGTSFNGMLAIEFAICLTGNSINVHTMPVAIDSSRLGRDTVFHGKIPYSLGLLRQEDSTAFQTLMKKVDLECKCSAKCTLNMKSYYSAKEKYVNASSAARGGAIKRCSLIINRIKKIVGPVDYINNFTHKTELVKNNKQFGFIEFWLIK